MLQNYCPAYLWLLPFTPPRNKLRAPPPARETCPPPKKRGPFLAATLSLSQISPCRSTHPHTQSRCWSHAHISRADSSLHRCQLHEEQKHRFLIKECPCCPGAACSPLHCSMGSNGSKYRTAMPPQQDSVRPRPSALPSHRGTSLGVAALVPGKSAQQVTAPGACVPPLGTALLAFFTDYVIMKVDRHTSPWRAGRARRQAGTQQTCSALPGVVEG